MKAAPAIIITSASRGTAFRGARYAPYRWLYLGRNVQQRRRVEAALGVQRRWPIGRRLQDIAQTLRQPYLDFIATLSRRQPDAVAWWSTTCSWRSPAVDDVLLLSCYARLAHDLVREAALHSHPLLLIIEDTWLLRQLWESLRNHPDVRCGRCGGLLRAQAWLCLRGVLARGRWFVVTVWSALRQRSVWRSVRHPRSAQPAVAIYSYPQSRCVVDRAEWRDPYLPGLEAWLQRLGYDVVRFVPTFATGFARALAARADYIEPLILRATPRALWRSLMTAWHPHWPDACALDGMPVHHLVQRARWVELGRSALCTYRFFYECLRNLLETRAWAWVIYPHENQPWEKLTALCAASRNIPTLGVQHSTLASMYLSYFLGAGEADVMPLPSRTWVAGPYPQRLLAEGGYPSDRLIMGGSPRYAHLAQEQTVRALRSRLGAAPRNEILVVLPDDIEAARHLLAAIASAFPLGGTEEGLRFHVKLHPATGQLTMRDVRFPATEAPADFSQALQRCGLVLYACSSVGIEAAVLGRSVVRYEPSLLLDMNPAELYGDRIPACTDETLREVLLAAVRAPDHRPLLDPQDVGRVFQPVQWHALETVVSRAGDPTSAASERAVVTAGASP